MYVLTFIYYDTSGMTHSLWLEDSAFSGWWQIMISSQNMPYKHGLVASRGNISYTYNRCCGLWWLVQNPPCTLEMMHALAYFSLLMHVLLALLIWDFNLVRSGSASHCFSLENIFSGINRIQFILMRVCNIYGFLCFVFI